ncbi:MAG: HDOD domain-containing protein [Phycisphaerales bacterium]|nr:MAG: HDOD domain-containing protein [Phycisphaerales bacterium]
MTGGVRTVPARLQSSRERVELILSQLDRLPTLPAVAARLLSVTTSNESCARDVVDIVESDPSLTAAVLNMVRRADLGASGQINTVQRAVTALGFRAVRNAVLSVHVYSALPHADASGNERQASARRELWKHSLAVACTADMLAERMNGFEAKDQAFVCGLLHDVGKIALDACLPKSAARVFARVDADRECICDAERELFGLDHTVAGKHLVTRWQLPETITESVWFHHQDPQALPSSVTSPQLVRLIHLADNVVREQRIGFSGYQHVADIKACAEALKIKHTAVDDVVEGLPARMEPLCALVGLDEFISQAIYTESLSKANRELGIVNSELAESQRVLELRARCFEALKQFTECLTVRAGIADVCTAAAGCVQAALDADGAVGFVCDATSRCMYVGRSGPSDTGGPSASIIEVGDKENRDVLGAAVAVVLERKIGEAPQGCELIWRRCMDLPAPGPIWMLSFAKTDAMVGAVLFVVGDDVVARWRGAELECHALSSAFERAVSSAQLRVESERMNEELLDLNRRLSTAQRALVRGRSISMIAEMAAGAAHELNNPMSVISGRAQMAMATSEDAELTQTLKLVKDKAHEASQIVTDLMHFAKPRAARPLTRELGKLLESCCQRWQARFALEQGRLTRTVDDPQATVCADPDQLQEILDAVVTNAVEACDPESLRLQVNSRSRESDETVRIVIEDNGAGMSPEVLEHAFDPFFSSRPAGRGRGLGLSRAYRLAEINGGCLWLESTLNVGTTVIIELPAHAPIS